MQVVYKKRDPGQTEFGIIYGGIAIAALIAPWFLPVLSLSPSCAFKGFFNVPCPTCGATRSLVRLSHGEFSSALAVNPITAIAIVSAIFFFFYSLTTLIFGFRRVVFYLTEREKNIARLSAVVLLLLQWGWLMVSL